MSFRIYGFFCHPATFDNSRVVFCFAGDGVRIGFLMPKIVNYINFFVILKRLSRNIWLNMTQTERDEQIIAFCDKIFLNYF